MTAEADRDAVLDAVAAFVASVPATDGFSSADAVIIRPTDRAVSIPGDVSYAARVLSVTGYGDVDAPALAILSAHLRAGVLYRRIRVEGGAYGGFSLYDPMHGQFAFLSYRDPNFESTLAVYDEAVTEMLREELDAETVRKLVLSAAGRYDRPLSPRLKGLMAFRRSLTGLTDEVRVQYRDGLLDVSADDVRRVATDVIGPRLHAAPQGALAPRQWIERFNAESQRPFAVVDLEP